MELLDERRHVLEAAAAQAGHVGQVVGLRCTRGGRVEHLGLGDVQLQLQDGQPSLGGFACKPKRRDEGRQLSRISGHSLPCI